MDPSRLSRFVPEHRRTNFKNRSAFAADELRRRREEAQVEIRKAKREESLAKRRNASARVGAEEIDSDDEEASINEAQAAGIPPLADLIQGVFSSDPQDQVVAATGFRKILSREHNPPIQKVVDAGVVPRLVELLHSANPVLQFEAAWALTNVSSGNSTQTDAVVSAGAVPVFVELLSSPELDVQEQAIWALGNIAGDSSQCRDVVLQAGALAPVLHHINSSKKIGLLRNAVWTLSNFCRSRSPQPDWEHIKTALPTLNRLLYYTDEEILVDACWAVSYLSDGSNTKIQAVIDTGIPRRLAELLSSANTGLLTPVLRSIGNIVTGDDYQTQVVINFGVLPLLVPLLSSPKDALRREACWTLSNITAGNPGQIRAVIDHNLVPPLINCMTTADFKTRREAAWAISNATSGASNNPELIRYLVNQGCIKPLCDLVSSHDNRVIQVALDGLENILRVGEAEKDLNGADTNEYALYVEEAGGLDSISDAQHNANEEIYARAYRIISTYYSGDDANADTGIEAQTADGMFDFRQQEVPGEQFSFANQE